MRILLLGGTSDARAFVKKAYERGLFDTQEHSVIYSVAGLVRQPDVPCEVISGGFTQFGGLASYIQSSGIDAIFDMTHPYAIKMSLTALNVSKQAKIPYWRFAREPWLEQADDKWLKASSWSEAVNHCANFGRILLTVGQLTQEELDELSAHFDEDQDKKLVLRTAAPPRVTLPESIQWIKAIGPFDFAAEKALLAAYKIDCLVSKNSGGKATQAKLEAARELSLPVVMIERPVMPIQIETCEQFSSIEACLAHIQKLRAGSSSSQKPGNTHAI